MSLRARQIRRAFFAGLALFVVSTLSITAYTLWRLRADAIINSLQVASLQARSFEGFLTQTLRVAELTSANLDGLATDVKDLLTLEVDLAASLRRTPFLRSLSVLDEKGRIVASTNPANRNLLVNTQNYLPLANNPSDLLRMGSPWAGRDFSSGRETTGQAPVGIDAQSFIPVVQALQLGQRRLHLLIALNPDYFLTHMSGTLDPKNGAVEVLRYDGTLLMSTDPEAHAGAVDAFVTRDLQLAEVESGAFEQIYTQGQPVLTAYQGSHLYPFVVVTRLDRERALQPWLTEVKTLLAVLAPALLAVIFLTLAYYRRLMALAAQRYEAQRLLRINATVFEASTEAIIITDPHANILSVNAAFTRITGYTEQEVQGRNPSLLASGQHDKAFYASLWTELLQAGVWHGEMRNKRKDGTPFEAGLSITLSRDSTGQLQHYVGVITDITERKQARLARDEALSRLKKIASRVPGVLYEFRLHPDGRASFPYASDAITAMYGNRITPSDVYQNASAVFALIHPDDLQGVSAAIAQSAKDMSLWCHEYRVKFDDGTVRWLLGNSMPEREADGSVLWHGFITDITERKQSEATVTELNRDFVSFLDNTSDFIYFKDDNSRFRFASQTLANITGHASWRDMIGKNDLEVFPPETAQIYHEEERPIFLEGLPLLNKVDPFFDAAGRKGWVSTNKWPLFDADAHVIGLFGISRDITDQKLSEEKLELAASVFSNSREGIMITAVDGTIVDVNGAFSNITGYSHDEVVGKTPRILNSGRQNKAHYIAMWQDLSSKGHWYGEVWNRRKNGEVYAEMLTISTVRDQAGEPQHYVALFSDITAAKEHEQQLEHIAHYDALTNLPNRVLLADRLSQSMAQAKRREMKLAVVFLDLDGFKRINDTYGHEAGDQLLMTLANRMRQALREGDTLARIGGDEFVAVLGDLSNTAESMPMLSRLQAAAAEPFQLGSTRLQVSASLGVTFYPQDEEIDADQLQRQADQAMYQAKLAGKNRFHIFNAEHDRSVRSHHETLEHIRVALARGELVLYYQPKVNMRTGQVIGVEALIRWQHPQQGLLAPACFLPVIENHPLAVDVGEWVMHTALAQMQTWHSAGLNMAVSVNIGARQLQQHDFVTRLQGILAAHPQVSPSRFELEVLETSALEDIAGVSDTIEQCRQIGVLFSLDDFGTGYSSLTYLKRLPVATLKIDRSFVDGMLDNPDDLAILQGIIGLARAFDREVIAEGVETVAHGAALLLLGCELAQGFGVARPMPADDLPAWVANWRPDASWSEQMQPNSVA